MSPLVFLNQGRRGNQPRGGDPPSTYPDSVVYPTGPFRFPDETSPTSLLVLNRLFGSETPHPWLSLDGHPLLLRSPGALYDRHNSRSRDTKSHLARGSRLEKFSDRGPPSEDHPDKIGLGRSFVNLYREKQLCQDIEVITLQRPSASTKRRKKKHLQETVTRRSDLWRVSFGCPFDSFFVTTRPLSNCWSRQPPTPAAPPLET